MRPDIDRRIWLPAYRCRRLVALLSSALAIVACASASGFANDGFYELASGHLRLAKADDIAILSEDLYVSMSRVTVTYEIKNLSAQARQALIGFPLPHPDALEEGADGPGPEGLMDMLKTFSTRVNGRRIKPTGRDVAVLLYPPFAENKDDPAAGITRAIDITHALRVAGIDISADNVSLNQLEDADIAARVAAQLPPVFRRDFPGWWEVRQIPYWRQNFKPGETIKVAHSYEPVPGGAIAGAFNIVNGSIDFPNSRTGYEFLSAELDFKRLRETWEATAKGDPVSCSIDESDLVDMIMQGVLMRFEEDKRDKQLLDNQDTYVTVSSDMTYILSTAQSWSGPIKKFKLTVDGEGMSLLFCLPTDIKLSDPERFVYQAEIENFDPASDLEIIRLF